MNAISGRIACWMRAAFVVACILLVGVLADCVVCVVTSERTSRLNPDVAEGQALYDLLAEDRIVAEAFALAYGR